MFCLISSFVSRTTCALFLPSFPQSFLTSTLRPVQPLSGECIPRPSSFSLTETLTQGNPLDILSRIQRLTKEFPRLQDECEAVFADKQVILHGLLEFSFSLFAQELVDVARRSLLGGSTATLKSLATRLGTNADIPVAQTSVHDALQRWNSSMSLVVGAD